VLAKWNIYSALDLSRALAIEVISIRSPSNKFTFSAMPRSTKFFAFLPSAFFLTIPYTLEPSFINMAEKIFI